MMRGTYVALSTAAGEVDANIGAPDDIGVDWWVEELDGWDLTVPEHEVTERPEVDGAWIDGGRYPSRVVTIRGAYKHGDHDEARRRLSRILATTRQRGTLTVTELDGSVRTSEFVARAGRLERKGNNRAPRWEVTVVCPDPRKYASTWSALSVVVSGSPDDTEGVTFDVTWPAVFFTPGQVAERPATVEVRGDLEVFPVVEFRGPVRNPSLELTATGQVVAAEIALGPGDYLAVDMAANTALLNGTSPRLGAITTDSEWWALQPGANPVRFAAAAYDAAVPSIIRWRDAWL